MPLELSETQKWLLVPIAISIVCSVFTIIVFGSYAQKLDQKFASINDRIGGFNTTNDTYRAQVAGYLRYLDSRINATSQQASIALEGCLSRINSLEKEKLNLQLRFEALNNSIKNINCTGTNTTIIYNNSVQPGFEPGSPVQNTSAANSTSDTLSGVPQFLQFQYDYPCMTSLMDQYDIGGYTCLRADCNRNVGWQQDACSCWGTFSEADKLRC
ncbi:MAG: hypothetical protein NT130_05810 [Candidatus Micrarchaeota archaeon]|nr:hypothetical protein [Candidatus Micrarchaeota archaeon]